MMTRCKEHLGVIAFGRLPNGYARLAPNLASAVAAHAFQRASRANRKLRRMGVVELQ